jgi:beta-phosphoglucomutase-like phosphatase (HAD superfamily)
VPDLVIFDCDGVLVDSEIIANGVMVECLNEAGVMLNVEQTMAFGVGKSATAVAAAVKTEFGVTLPANFFEDMGARIIAAYPGRLRPIVGAKSLNKIRRAYRRSGFRAKLNRTRLIYAAGIGLIVRIGMAVFHAIRPSVAALARIRIGRRRLLADAICGVMRRTRYTYNPIGRMERLG